MIAIGCDCGWRSSEPSRRQAEAALDDHRRLHCTKERTCAICTEVAPGALRVLDDGKPAVFVCNDCDDVHPNTNRYVFSDDGASKPGVGFVPKRRTR